jgi:hypothetical protein
MGLGNQVTTNSSACTTGAESILMAYERIKSGLANRMLEVPVTVDLIFGVVLMPCVSVLLNIILGAGNKAMSASASGFVPEVELRRFKDLETALSRGVEFMLKF